MSKWDNYQDGAVFQSEDSGYNKKICAAINGDIARQIVREHNAHAELVSCLKAMLKITCGECRGEKSVINCPADPLACALSAQARAAIEAAEGRE